MRFIGKYTNFFKDKPQDLVLPLDRENARMVNHLVDSTFLAKYRSLCRGLAKSSRSSYYQFKNIEMSEFQALAEEIMGSKRDRIMLDNFWFVGHFYHDNPQQDRRLRQSILTLDEPYVNPYFKIGENIELPVECPFSKIECRY